MYDLSELKPTGKDIAVAILVVTVLLVVIFCAGYLFGLRNASGTDVSDNGKRIDDIREQLGTITEHQRELTAGIDSTEERVARIEGGVQRVSEAAERAEVAITDSGKLIDECQQIIGTIRNRGKK